MNKKDQTAIDLLSMVLGRRVTAECAIAYLAKQQRVPAVDAIEKALAVPHSIAEKIYACAQLSFQYLLNRNPVNLNDPSLVGAYLCDLKDCRVEHYVLLTLTADNTLINRHECGIGTTECVTVSKRDLLAKAIADGATSIIIAHNHPSGTIDFSKQDIDNARKLYKNASSLSIRLLDSIVISSEGVKSLRKEQPSVFGERKK